MRFIIKLLALAGAVVAVLVVAVAIYFAMVAAGWLNPWPALEDVHANVLGAASALWAAAKSLATASWAALQGAGMSPPVQFAGVLAATSLLAGLLWWGWRSRKPVAEPAVPAPAADAPAAPRPNVIQVTDVTLTSPSRWWSAKRKWVWNLAVVSKITGVVPIRTQAAAQQAMHDHMQAMDALLRALAQLYPELVAHLGRLPSHRAVLQLLHDLLAAAKRDGKIVIETANAPKASAAKTVKKLGRFARIGAAAKLLWNGEVPKPTTTPRKRKVAENAAPAPVAEVATPVVVPETAPAPVAAAATATVELHVHATPAAEPAAAHVTEAERDAALVEALAEQDAAARPQRRVLRVTPPLPAAEAPLGDRGDKGGRHRSRKDFGDRFGGTEFSGK